MFSRFSRKKRELEAQVAILRMLEKSIGIELKTFTNHLTTVQMSYNNIQAQNVEIITLLKEQQKNGR